MKRSIKTIALLLILVAPLTATAQKSLVKAIDDFTNGSKSVKYMTARNEISERDTDSGLLASYKEYAFTTVANDPRFVALRNAFYGNQGKAYNVLVKTAGKSLSELHNVAYGVRMDKTVSFGSHIDRNYILLYVRNPGNTLWRTAYALVWYESKGNAGMIDGTLHVISSPDPKKADKAGSSSYTVTRTTTSSDGNSTVIRVLPNGTVVKSDKNNVTRIIYPDGSKTVLSEDDKSSQSDKVKSADEFMRRFGNYRSLYISMDKFDAKQMPYLTSIANNVLSLCKNYSCLLTADEKAVCATGLRKMQKVTHDDYLYGLLEVAARALK